MFDNLQPVTISARAITEIQKIIQTKNIPGDYGLRVGIKGAGCGGAALLLGFDKQKESDLVYTIDNIPVYVDKKHALYVIGKEIDFLESEDARGFMFVDKSHKEETDANDE
jgi:iron-sulfur cluster assembly protein